jgi:hypothetical protein
MNDQSWTGEHLIRIAPRPRETVAPTDVAPDDKAATVIALRQAAAEGRRRTEVAEELGLTYNQAVALCMKHDIRFTDPRYRRRREGMV